MTDNEVVLITLLLCVAPLARGELRIQFNFENGSITDANTDLYFNSYSVFVINRHWFDWFSLGIDSNRWC